MNSIVRNSINSINVLIDNEDEHDKKYFTLKQWLLEYKIYGNSAKKMEIRELITELEEKGTDGSEEQMFLVHANNIVDSDEKVNLLISLTLETNLEKTTSKLQHDLDNISKTYLDNIRLFLMIYI